MSRTTVQPTPTADIGGTRAPGAPTPGAWLSVTQAAQATGTSRFTLYSRIRLGLLPFVHTSLGVLMWVPQGQGAANA